MTNTQNAKGARYTNDEIRIIMTCNHRKACRLLPHRKPSVIAAKRHHIKNLKAIKTSGKRFTQEEKDRLSTLYNSTPNRKLLEHFPGRNIESIMRKATSMGLSKKFEAMSALTGDKEIIHQILRTARDRGIPAGHLDDFCKTKRYFQNFWRRHPINLTAVQRAMELLGGRLVADFSFMPFGDESRRLLMLLNRFSAREIPNIAATDPKKKLARVSTSYPFANARTSGNKLVLAVNELVPQGVPGREDVCQTILLSILEGTVTLEQVRANKSRLRDFVRTFAKANYENRGFAVSMDAPTLDGKATMHDRIAAPV